MLSGLRRRMGLPRPYRLVQTAVGSAQLWRWFVDSQLLPLQPNRILDIGCGPSDILAYLPDHIDYVGMDPHAPYVDAAQQRYGSRGRWLVQSVTETTARTLGDFDVVLLLGVLHHCSDAKAMELLKQAQSVLTEGGTVLHLDGCLHPNARWLETMLYRLERGLYVRDEAGYANLMQGAYGHAVQVFQDGLLRVPYRYCVGKHTF